MIGDNVMIGDDVASAFGVDVVYEYGALILAIKKDQAMHAAIFSWNWG